MSERRVEQRGSEVVVSYWRFGRWLCEGRGPTEQWAEEVARLELADLRRSKS